ncbi:acyl carrier protein [Mumia flava]|uniref:Acyl carrier protein n=1 Tax=Mumia flava TaxID=1348852 RepID=A0A0B2BBK0_9ACTN|nr:phosphopantetheine-binding protein [Mumia flava]PJJ53832.1 acyl carrier protein [Mumia flava]
MSRQDALRSALVDLVAPLVAMPDGALESDPSISDPSFADPSFADLGLDEVALDQLVLGIEDRFGITVSAGDIGLLSTLGDTAAYLEGRLHG